MGGKVESKQGREREKREEVGGLLKGEKLSVQGRYQGSRLLVSD